MKKIITLAVAILAVCKLAAQQTETFAFRDTMELKMDIYQPTYPRADKACVVYVFGGGFAMGQRDVEKAVAACRAYADRGFVAVSIDYRLFLKIRKDDLKKRHTPLLKAYLLFDTSITWAVEDCSAAIAYLCQNSCRLNIDTSKIVLTGNSAGAITVLQTDYCRANSLPASTALPQGFRPAAVVPYAGAILCGNCQLKYANPPAPTFFLHGTKDRMVHYSRQFSTFGVSLFGSNRVAQVFEREGYPYWIFRFEGMTHEVAAAHAQTVDEFCAFVENALAGTFTQYDAVCRNSNIRPTKWSGLTVFDAIRGMK